MKRVIVAALLALTTAGSDRAYGEPPPTLTFEALWSHAKRHAPQLVLTRTQALARAALEAQARPALAHDPTLALSLGPRFQAGYRDYDVSASLTQPLRVAGEPALEKELARQAAARLDAEVASEQSALRGELRALFRAAVVASERVRLLELARASQARVVALLERRVSVGEGSPLDRRLGELELLEAQQASLAASHALRDLRLELASRAGLPFAALPELTEDAAPPTPPALEPLLREAQASSPRLLALRAKLAEAGARSRVRERERFGTPELGLTYARQGTTPASDPVSHTVFGTVALPLSLWRRNRPERAEARAAQALTQAELAREERELSGEITRAHATLSQLHERLALYERELLPKFDEHLAMVEKALGLGELTIFEFLAVRARLLQARLDALALRAAYGEAWSALERTLGRDLVAGGER